MNGEGKVIVSGFNLEESEKTAVSSIIESYKEKIKNKFGFEELKIRLKKSLHGKAFLHELQGTLISNEKQFKTETSDYNLFSALHELFEKLMHEAEHTKRTSRQINKNVK